MNALGRSDEEYLLLNSKNEHVEGHALGVFVQHLTFEEMGETNYFKVKINNINGDLNK